MATETNPELLCPATGELCLARQGIVEYRDGLSIVAAIISSDSRPRPGLQDQVLETMVTSGLILAQECDGTECSTVKGIKAATSDIV